MQLVGSGQARLPISENHLEFPRTNQAAGRESPLSKVGVGVGQVKAIQRDCICAGIVQLKPASALAEVVGNAAEVIGLDLIKPQGWERSQHGSIAVKGSWGCRSEHG